MVAYPEQSEFVVATVKKVMPYGAFLSLDEYAGIEGFVHISQVSTGWVRNIREYLREGQKIVAKVHVLDLQKGQIDLTLKGVSDSDKRRKLEAFQAEKKGRKLVEVAGAKLKKTPALAWKEAGEPLLKHFGSLAAGLEAVREGQAKDLLPQAWKDVLKEILDKELKPKRISVRANLTLKFASGDGVEKLIAALKAFEKTGDGKTLVKVRYLGAPHYFVDVESGDYKAASKVLEKAEAALAAQCSGSDCEYLFEREK